MPIDQLVAESGCWWPIGRGDGKPKCWTRVAGRIVFSHEQAEEEIEKTHHQSSLTWQNAFTANVHEISLLRSYLVIMAGIVLKICNSEIFRMVLLLAHDWLMPHDWCTAHNSDDVLLILVFESPIWILGFSQVAGCIFER